MASRACASRLVEARLRTAPTQQAAARLTPPLAPLADVPDYPEYARGVLLGSAEGVGDSGHWRELPCSLLGLQEPGATVRPSTKYEREGLAAGRSVVDLTFEAA